MSTTGWSYDANGNETAATPGGGAARTGESWNDFGQQTSITAGSTTYAVGERRRRKHRTDPDRRHLVPPDPDRTRRVHNWQPGHRICPRTGGNPQLHDEGRQEHNYLTDATGNVLGLVDPTGLYKMGARSYDPNLARFTTTDPSGQEDNAYLYADGDPINRTDPSGLFSLSKGLKSLAGGALGVVVGTALTPVLGPWAGALVGGCVGGVVGAAWSGGDLGDSAMGYGAGMALGALGRGLSVAQAA